MVASHSDSPESPIPLQMHLNSSPKWLTLAIVSGATAAFNGVFAKLTTTAQTHSLVESISHGLGFAESSNFIEIVVRAGFFGCNLLSNALMWILFTRALTASNSTTRVSILNTAANFLMTAMLGMMIFAERLPLGWWGGALLLVGGSVIVGARDSSSKDEVATNTQDEVETVAMDASVGGIGESTVDTRYSDEDEHGEDERIGDYKDDVDTRPTPIT